MLDGDGGVEEVVAGQVSRGLTRLPCRPGEGWVFFLRPPENQGQVRVSEAPERIGEGPEQLQGGASAVIIFG